MREIKFRAWCEVDKAMYFNVEYGIDFDDESHYPFHRFKGIEYQERHDYHVWHLMQYTGLKDKNGVEIYESDIVSGDSILKVIFHDSGWWLFSDDEKETWPFAACALHLCEVIGNIYENKELLDGVD